MDVTNPDCDHDWVSCEQDVIWNGVPMGTMGLLVYHEGLDGCESWKENGFTVFHGCGIPGCGMIYKNSDSMFQVFSLQATMQLLVTCKSHQHTGATIAAQEGSATNPMPTGYYFVATQQCSKCGQYAE